MMGVSDKNNISGQSSPSTKLWAGQAKAIIAEAPEAKQMDALLTELAASQKDMSDADREQMRELAELLASVSGESQLVKGLRQDGEFETRLSDDGMFLSVSIHLPVAGGEPVSVQKILDWLKGQNIEKGVNLQAIRQAVRLAGEGKAVYDEVIVRGREPGQGQDGYYELFARRSVDSPPENVYTSDGNWEINYPLICAAGDRIVRCIPPKSGRAGYNALGVVLEPPEPNSVQIQPGVNVRVEGEEYFATTGGLIQRNHGYVIEVRRLLAISKDITRRESPISFDGDVQIHGTVRSGTLVKATGDIRVIGPVEDATIESSNGSVFLEQGISGRRKGVLRAKRNVETHFVESASIYADGNISILTGAMHSRLVAGSTITATQGRGQLIGGSAMAGDLIEAKQLGSKGGVVTELSVGLSFEVMTKAAEIDAKNDEILHRRNEAAELADKMERAIGNPKSLPPAELEAYLQLRQLQLVCDYRIRKANEQREAILAAVAQNYDAKVTVSRKIMGGVIVRIGASVLRNTQEHERCKLVYDKKDGRIVVRSL
ncbi:MAG: DUF342 domain-containing protein [Planctomycetes bacterium]|nr:DUF342 domain-containing protein [Planctomycetota bacterium]